MKYLAAIMSFGVMGLAYAQSTNREIELYERYENGELVEQRQSATENGKPIENFDFEELKRKMVAKSSEIDAKMREMEVRLQERQAKMSMDMDKRMRQMEERMANFEEKSEKMHQRMDQRLMQMKSKRENSDPQQPTQTPIPEEEGAPKEQMGALKFT